MSFKTKYLEQKKINDEISIGEFKDNWLHDPNAWEFVMAFVRDKEKEQYECDKYQHSLYFAGVIHHLSFKSYGHHPLYLLKRSHYIKVYNMLTYSRLEYSKYIEIFYFNVKIDKMDFYMKTNDKETIKMKLGNLKMSKVFNITTWSFNMSISYISDYDVEKFEKIIDDWCVNKLITTHLNNLHSTV
jgi:hypothetical protein